MNNPFRSTRIFFVEMVDELKKASWPTRTELRDSTIVVIAASLLLGSFPATALALAKNPDTYTYLTISDADSMDPAWSYDTASDLIILNVYEPLVMFDKTSTEKLTPSGWVISRVRRSSRSGSLCSGR